MRRCVCGEGGGGEGWARQAGRFYCLSDTFLPRTLPTLAGISSRLSPCFASPAYSTLTYSFPFIIHLFIHSLMPSATPLYYIHSSLNSFIHALLYLPTHQPIHSSLIHLSTHLPTLLLMPPLIHLIIPCITQLPVYPFFRYSPHPYSFIHSSDPHLFIACISHFFIPAVTRSFSNESSVKRLKVEVNALSVKGVRKKEEELEK